MSILQTKLFFGLNPTEVLKFSPHKRSWILQGMRHFGNYYHYKVNNPECKELIEKIISRYGLNVGLDMHQKIYIVDDNFVVNKIKELMTIHGEIGLTVKVGLFSGLREDEIIYIHNTEICNNLGGCNCNKLHVIDKSNGATIIVVNWFRAHKKCYFTILPTKIWQECRRVANFNDVDIDVAHQITKKIANTPPRLKGSSRKDQTYGGVKRNDVWQIALLRGHILRLSKLSSFSLIRHPIPSRTEGK